MVQVPFLHVTVDPNSLKDNSLKIVKILRPQWNTCEVKTKVYFEGFASRVCCCHRVGDDSKSDAIVVRVHNEINNNIAHSEFNEHDTALRDKQVMAMQLAHVAGCFPTILCIFRNGLVHKRVTGRALRAADMDNSSVIRSVMLSLAKFHMAELTRVPFINSSGNPSKFPISSLDQQMATYLNMLNSTPDHLEEPDLNLIYRENKLSQNEFRREFEAMWYSLEGLGLGKGVIHGDLHITNAVMDEKTGFVSFCDFESCDVGYAALDLVKMFTIRPILEVMGVVSVDEPRVTPTIRAAWLRSYLEARQQLLGAGDLPLSQTDLHIAEAEYTILEMYQSLIYLVVWQSFVSVKPLRNTSIKMLKEERMKWTEAKRELDHVKHKYLELRSCST